MAVIGCDYASGPIVGSESIIGKTSVWVRTHFQQKGHYLHATTYLVAAGRPKVFELRLDLRPIEAAMMRAHKAMHARRIKAAAVSGQPLVGWGVGKLWKKAKRAAKKIGRSKLLKQVGRVTKGVVKVTKGVVKSKITGALGAVLTVFPPTAAVGAGLTAAYVAANAAVKAIESGKKVADGAMEAKRLIDDGVKAAKGLKKVGADAKKALRLKAGAKLSLKAQLKARARARLKARGAKKPGGTLVRLTAKGKRVMKTASASKRAALLAALKRRALLKKKRAKKTAAQPVRRNAAKVSPSVARKRRAILLARKRAMRAASLKKKLKQPAVRKKLSLKVKQAAAAKKALESIATRARYGSGKERLDARKSAAIINLVAKNRGRVRAMTQIHAGGLPAMLVDSRGRIRPGRFRAKAIPSGVRPDVLYMGPGQPSQSGHYARIAGDSSSLIGAAVGSPLIGCGDMPCARCK